jgi:hypothetical protein
VLDPLHGSVSVEFLTVPTFCCFQFAGEAFIRGEPSAPME